MPTQVTAKLLIDAQCKLAEGPVWHEDALWWTDINGKMLHRLHGQQHQTWPMPVRIGTMVPTDQGRWVLAGDDGFHFWTPGQERIRISDPQTGGTRFNDGKAGPDGQLFAGTMVLDGPKQSAAFYRMDPGGEVTRLFDGVGTSNGLAWSADRWTFWYADTPTGRVDAFDYDAATASLSNRRPAVQHFPGHPDGLTIDRQDMLWVCQWGGRCVVHCDPRTGEHLGRVELAVPNVTSACFGGPDLRTLYITTAGSDDQGSGGIWMVDDAGVAGLPVDLYHEG